MNALRPLLLILVWLTGLTLPVPADPLPVSGPAQDLTKALTYAPGMAQTPETMLEQYRAGTFAPTLDVRAFETQYAPERWAAVDMLAEDPITGRIAVRVPVVTTLDLYLVRGQEITPVLTYSLLEAVVPEEHAGGRLMSMPVTLNANDPVTLLAHIRFGPFETIEMAFETAPVTLDRAQLEAAWMAAFYAFGFACLLVFLALFAAIEDWISLFFAVMFFFGLLLIASLDGLLLRILHPDTPTLLRPLGLGAFYGLAGSGYALSAYGFRVAGRHRAERAMYALLALCAVSFAVTLVWPAPQAFAFGNGLLAIMFVSVILGTRAWEDQRLPAGTLSTGIAIVAGLGFAALVGTIALGGAQKAPDVPTTAKLLFLLTLLATLIRYGAQVVMIRRAETAAQAAERAALDREAVLNRQLLEAEQGYSRARDLAEARRRKLASASHDLRQPLSSLRMTVDSLARDLDPGSRARLSEAFDYIAGLSGSYLDEATTQEPDRAEEPYALALIFETVRQMFAEEAAAKGLSLRVVPVGWETDVPPMALMRIVSNLTANAIRATQAGGVLIGARRDGARRRLMVCDTGPGLTAEALGRLRAEGAKGEGSDGHGLGLATCFGLAETHGLTLTAEGRPGHGTCFALGLPPVATA